MKKYYLYVKRLTALLLLVLPVIIYSCRKNNGTDSINDNVLQARSWYQQIYPINKNGLNTQSINEDYGADLSQTLSPDWTKAEFYNRQNKEVIELPLNNAMLLGVTSNAPNTTGITYNARRNNCISRFLILKDDKGYQAVLMTIVADSNWLAHNYQKLKQQTYRHKDEDFTGKVLYFTPRGQLLNGYRYSNGIINGKISSAAVITSKQQIQQLINSPKQKTLTESCTYEYNYVYQGRVALEDMDGNIIGFAEHYILYITETCYQQSDQPIGIGDDGGFGSPNGGVTVVPVSVSYRIIQDSLRKYFPCASKLVIDKLLSDPAYNDFVSAFTTNQRPDLKWECGNLPWNQPISGSTLRTYQLGQEGADPTSSLNLSRIVTLNTAMLQNSSQLLITATAIHETLHAYIKYNVAIAIDNMNNQYNDYGTWFSALDAFYSIRSLPANYSNHYQMLTDYFNQALSILSTADNGHHSQKEYAMAMLYGLNTVDDNCPLDMKIRLDQVFSDMKTTYKISDQDLTTFNTANLNAPAAECLPKSGC